MNPLPWYRRVWYWLSWHLVDKRRLTPDRIAAFQKLIAKLEAEDEVMPLRPCEPEILQGPNGYLAVTPPDHPYRIGVVGADEDEARRRFVSAFAAWEELHERAEAKAPDGWRRDEGRATAMNLRYMPSAMAWFLALIGLGLAIGEAIGGASAYDVLIVLLGAVWVLMYGSMAAQRDDAIEQLRHRTEQYRALMERR
jgi:hypothetical protein